MQYNKSRENDHSLLNKYKDECWHFWPLDIVAFNWLLNKEVIVHNVNTKQNIVVSNIRQMASRHFRIPGSIARFRGKARLLWGTCCQKDKQTW